MAKRDDNELELQQGLTDADERIARLDGEALFPSQSEALRDSEARFRILVENSPDVIMTLDRDATILFINYTLPHLSVDEVVGTNVLQYVEGADRSRYEHAFAEVIASGTTHSLELAAEGPTWWLTRLIPIKTDDGGDVETVLVIATDITERKRAEEQRRTLEAQVQHAQKLESLGVLAGGIAHDFNNLLTGILGSASLAIMKVPEDSPAKEQLNRILTAAEKAAELTNQMLAYAGKGRFMMGPLDLNQLLHEVVPLVRTSIAKEITLRESYAENLPSIDADKTQLHQVVMNLITNASESLGDDEGVVSIRTGALEARGERDSPHEATAKVFLEVSDTGQGMDAETKAKMFDPFFSTKFTGRGLGLAAVQGIVRAHGGTMRVDSKPHRGTTFTVLFPSAHRDVSPIIDEADAGPVVRASGTILVIDDEESVRTVARIALEEKGFEVILANDGFDAIEVFRRRASSIDAVLLDLSMPRLSGEETLAELRDARPDIRIVLTSGHSEQEISHKFAGKGLAGFVQKPFRASELVDEIQSALNASAPSPTES